MWRRRRTRLLDAVGQAVIATDPSGVVLFWNAAAHELYGWSAEEAVGRSILDLTPSSASVEQAEQIMMALRAGRRPALPASWTGGCCVAAARSSRRCSRPAPSPRTPTLP